MNKLKPEEVITILNDMKVSIPVPKAAVMQTKRNMALNMAISALEKQDSKTRKICNTCKHDPPSKKWPCVDCDMRDPADRWEPKGEQVAKILADILSGCPLLDPCSKIWTLDEWCKDHCKPGQQEPDSECWLKYAEVMVKETESSNKSSLTQNTLNVPDINVSDMVSSLSSTQPETCAYWDRESNFCALHEPSAQPDHNADRKNDLISRQAAIDAVHKYYDIILDFKSDGRTVADSFEDIIDVLPSAQSEPTTEIQKILNYLDIMLHPIVSPDNWNVYSKLYDMVISLSSAQPEIIRCKDCKHSFIHNNGEKISRICGLTRICGTTPDDWYCGDAERRTDD